MSSHPLHLFFCDHHPLPLPDGHKFPLSKYRLVRDIVVQDGRFHLQEAPFVTPPDLARVHSPSYISSFLNGTLDQSVIRRIGFPWSLGLVNRTLASTGGTLAAAKTAIATGFAGTVAGGTHHAFRNEGAGFCVFNDLAVAAEWLRHCAGVTRIAVVDLDVHQGDGTASIFQDDPGIFTLSLHGARNFPFRKQRSRLDVEFPDGTTGAAYLAALRSALNEVWAFDPQLILFQSGVDGLVSDRLGRLALTLDDLAERDCTVFGAVRRRQVPIVVTMGGGYSDPIQRDGGSARPNVPDRSRHIWGLGKEKPPRHDGHSVGHKRGSDAAGLGISETAGDAEYRGYESPLPIRVVTEPKMHSPEAHCRDQNRRDGRPPKVQERPLNHAAEEQFLSDHDAEVTDEGPESDSDQPPPRAVYGL